MSLPRLPPSEVGLNSNAIVQLSEKLGALNCHSFMIVRHSHVVAEGWWAPYKKEYRHSMYSVTKSFTSLAIGFAIQEGLLNLHDPVLKFFPKLLPCTPCENMTKMTVRDLLTMRTGHSIEPNSWNALVRSREERHSDNDHTYHFLTSYVDHEPGTLFMYNTPATFILGAILHALTSQDVFQYLKPRLLDPLGITDYHCEVNAKGLAPAGFGAHLRTEDLAKLGLFLLHRGEWNGEQLLSASWIDEATAKHVDTSDHPLPGREWRSGYGYQFWRCSPQNAYRADGIYGQLSIVMPDQDLVIAITSGTENMGGIFEALWSTLLPALDQEVSPDPALPETLSRLQIRPLAAQSRTKSKYSGRFYQLASNSLRLTKIGVQDNGTESIATLWRGDKQWSARVGYGVWIETTTGSDDDGMGDFFSEVACSGYWDENSFEFKIVYTRTPFSDQLVLNFDDHGVLIDFKRYPSLWPDQQQLMGREIQG